MLNFSANLSLLFNEIPILDRFIAAKKCGFNGIEIQSKVGSSSLIDKHFEKYPHEDYPNRLLVTNTEAAEEYIKRHPENADKIIDGGPIKHIKDQYYNSSNSAILLVLA